MLNDANPATLFGLPVVSVDLGIGEIVLGDGDDFAAWVDGLRAARAGTDSDADEGDS